MIFEGSFKRVEVVRTFMQNWVGHQTDLANLLFYALSHITVLKKQKQFSTSCQEFAKKMCISLVRKISKEKKKKKTQETHHFRKLSQNLFDVFTTRNSL